MPEHQNRRGPARQAGQRPPDLGPRLPLQHLLLGAGRSRLGRRQLLAPLAAPLTSDRVQCRMSGSDSHPSGSVVTIRRVWKPAERGDKDVLRHVLGKLSLTDHGEGDPDDHRVMLTEELLESGE